MLELGPDAAKYHSELGSFVNRLQNIHKVYLLGELSKNTENAINKKPVYRAGSSDELIEFIQKYGNNTPKTVYLFKGSRSMKLEEVYNALKKY